MADLFLNSKWLAAISVALAACFIICIWAYRTKTLSSKQSFLLGFIKFLVFATLAWSLLEPNRKIEKPAKGHYRVIVMSDDSQSMKEFSYGEKKASEHALELLTQQGPWLDEVKENFQVLHYKFGMSLQSQKDASQLEFQQSQSDFAQSLEDCFQLHDPNLIAAIVVLSDGQVQTQIPEKLQKLCPPLFFSQLAVNPELPDLSLVEANAKASTYEDAPTKIHAVIKNRDLKGKEIKVNLYDPEDKLAHKERLTLEHEHHDLDFEIKPKFPGLQYYRLEVQLVDKSIKEQSSKNNQWQIKVDQKTGPFKVLYVSGRPNWEYKFIRRALEDDPMVELSALIRIAKGETKFEFRDKEIASVNPLFKGLDKEKAEREADFDEPVFLRLNIEKEDELSKGFPSSKAALYRFQMIIIDDLESEFFSADQLQLIKEFVQKRGGACLFLGGQETFSTGGYNDTTLKGMMPVYFDQVNEDDSEINFQLTREGSLTPWARVSSELDREKIIRQRMPSFLVNHRFSKAKPGSSVIATHSSDSHSKPQILLASQDYGLGKSAILSIGDFWRWHMQPLVEDELFKQWRQIIRYMISDTPHQYEMKLNQIDDYRYQVVANLVDHEFNPTLPTDLKLTETSTNGEKQDLVLKRDPEDPNRLILDRHKNSDGHYHYQLSFKDTQNPNKKIELHNSVHLQVEHIETQWNEQAPIWLTKLAESSKGQVLTPSELTKLSQLIPTKKLTETEITYQALWDKTYVWIPLVLLLCLEWGLRRRWGLS